MTGAKENTEDLKGLKSKSSIINNLDKTHISVLSTVVQFKYINSFVHLIRLNVFQEGLAPPLVLT